MMSEADRVEQMGQATREKLRQFIARIMRLEAEKSELTTDIREVYSEVKSFGFDQKVLRKLIALMKTDANERAEQEALLDLYMGAVDGDFDGIDLSAMMVAKPASKNTVVLMDRDGTQREIEKDNPLENFMYEGKFYLHYKDNAWKQV